MPGVDLSCRAPTSAEAIRPIVTWLIEQTKSILRGTAPQPDDDFFDLGGDSMSALALFAAIEQQYGCALPLTTIYDAPTMTDLATRITRIRPIRADVSCLVPIAPAPQPHTAHGAVVLIHGIGGHVFDLLRLGAMIESPHSVSALRARGLADGEIPLDRIEAMAASGAELLRTTYPNQVIHLIGYSFGGMIAIEIARRLRSAGTKIGGVVLLDSYPHPQRWPRLQAFDVRLRRIRNQLAVLRDADWPARIAYGRSRLGLGAETGQGSSSRAQWLAAPAGATADIRAVVDAASIAIDHYQPSLFDHPVTFIRPEVPSAFLPIRPRAVWQSLLPDLDVQTVPGDHVTMLDDHATDLAVLLSRAIARADGRGA
jgi:thioesterase domain-containing protein/acyl carrier protein